MYAFLCNDYTRLHGLSLGFGHFQNFYLRKKKTRLFSPDNFYGVVRYRTSYCVISAIYDLEDAALELFHGDFA
jgi:hypothetical protein